MWTQDLRNLQWLESFSMSLLAAMSMREQQMLTYVSYIDAKTCYLGIYTVLISVSRVLWFAPVFYGYSYNMVIKFE